MPFLTGRKSLSLLSKGDMLYLSKLWCLLIFVHKDYKCPGAKTFPFKVTVPPAVQCYSLASPEGYGEKLDWANSAPTYPQTGHHSRHRF